MTTTLTILTGASRGMGLAIARQVARCHGGDVTVGSPGGPDCPEPTAVIATLPDGIRPDET